MIPSSKTTESLYHRYIKRMIDLTLALILLFVFIPTYIVVSIVILVETGLPIIYRAERGGYHGKTFKIYKFRTMVKDADKIGSGTTALNDSRITKIGLFLRKTKLDEIPQLLNIVKGEMSFVGPRPELLKYTLNYHDKEEDILKVRPGITDYSSIHYINEDEIVGETNAEEVYETKILPYKNELRIKYVETVSFKTDVKLLFFTIVKVIHNAVRYIRG